MLQLLKDASTIFKNHKRIPLMKTFLQNGGYSGKLYWNLSHGREQLKYIMAWACQKWLFTWVNWAYIQPAIHLYKPVTPQVQVTVWPQVWNLKPVTCTCSTCGPNTTGLPVPVIHPTPQGRSNIRRLGLVHMSDDWKEHMLTCYESKKAARKARHNPPRPIGWLERKKQKQQITAE